MEKACTLAFAKHVFEAISKHTNVFDGMSQNLPWEIIRDNPDKSWNWYNVSCNASVTWDIIKANPDKHWNFSSLTDNKNITWDIINSNPDHDWNWLFLSKEVHIDTIGQHVDKPWHWNYCQSQNVLQHHKISILYYNVQFRLQEACNKTL